MGDTFTDSWEGTVPEKFGDWIFRGVTNSKWTGNFYVYEYDEEKLNVKKDWARDVRKQVTVQSTSNSSVRLDGLIQISVGCIDMSIRNTGRYESPSGEWLDGLEWTDFTQALTDLTQKAEKLYEQALKFAQECEEPGKWEPRG